MNRAEAFGRVYERGLWSGGGAPSSGLGSDIDVARPYVEYVQALIARQRPEHVVDIGHGDWQMWPEDAFADTRYTGFDVAPGLSRQVAAIRGRQNRTFQEGDAVESELPAGDLALCKDVLQHLSNADVSAVLGKLAAFPAVIICHDVAAPPRGLGDRLARLRFQAAPRYRLRAIRDGSNPFGSVIVEENADIASGGYRCLDIGKAPWQLHDLGLTVIDTFDFPASAGRWTGAVKRVWHCSGYAA